MLNLLKFLWESSGILSQKTIFLWTKLSKQTKHIMPIVFKVNKHRHIRKNMHVS